MPWLPTPPQLVLAIYQSGSTASGQIRRVDCVQGSDLQDHPVPGTARRQVLAPAPIVLVVERAAQVSHVLLEGVDRVGGLEPLWPQRIDQARVDTTCGDSTSSNASNSRWRLPVIRTS